MALSNLGLGLLFTAQDQASSVVKGLSSNVAGLGKQSDRTSRALTAGIGGTAAIALGTSLGKVVDQAADFEFGLAEVKNIAGATAKDMMVLRDAAFEAGLKTQFSPTQAVEGLRNFAAAGFDAATSARLLDRSLILAQAGQISVAQSTATMATAIKLFNLQGSDQTLVVDKLLKTTNLFKIQASDLEQGLAKTSAAALLTNQSVDEMLLTMGLIKNVFPDAGEAGNSVGRAMQSLAQKAGKVKSKFGVDVLDAEGAFKPALDIFLELDETSKTRFENVATRTAELTKLMGAFGGKGFAAAIGSIRQYATSEGITLKESAARLRGAITGAEGTADEFLAGLNATFKGQKIILQGAIETLMVALGEPLLKVLQPAVRSAAEAVANVARAVKNADPALKEVFSRIALIASGMLTLGGAVGILKASMFILIPVFKAAIAGFIGMTLAAAPLILVIGTIGAAVAGLSDSMGGASISADGLASSASDVLRALKAIGQVLVKGQISEGLRTELEDAGASGTLAIVRGVKAIRDVFVGFFTGVRQEFARSGPALTLALKGLGSAFMDLGRALGFVRESGGAGDALPNAGAISAGANAARLMALGLEAMARVLSAIIRFGAQVITGITGAFEGSGPVVKDFTRALGTLAFNLGIVADDAVSSGKSGESFGRKFGKFLGNVAILAIRLATVMIDVTTRIIAGVRAMVRFIIDTGRKVIGVFRSIKDAISELIGFFGKLGDAVVSTMHQFTLIKDIFSGDMGLGVLSDGFNALVDAIKRAIAVARDLFNKLQDITGVGGFTKLMEFIPTGGGSGSARRVGTGIDKDTRIKVQSIVEERKRIAKERGVSMADAARIQATEKAAQQKAQTATRGGFTPEPARSTTDAESIAVQKNAAMSAEQTAAQMKLLNDQLVAQGGQALVIELDGERVGRAIRRANRRNDADGFQSVGTGEDL